MYGVSVIDRQLNIRAFTPCATWGEVARCVSHDWLGWREINRCFYTIMRGRLALPGNGSQSHLATRAHAIRNYSRRGSILFDNSPVGVLVFLGFATRVINVLSMRATVRKIASGRVGFQTVWNLFMTRRVINCHKVCPKPVYTASFRQFKAVMVMTHKYDEITGIIMVIQ